LWLLLRAHDATGRGWVGVEEAIRLFSAAGSTWRLFTTRRRARQILDDGEGVFWIRRPSGLRGDGPERLWLSGAAKAAAELDVDRLAGDPVDIPINQLTCSIGDVRAAFHAAALTLGKGRPMARATIRGLTGTAESTQRGYDKAAGVAQQRHVGIIPAGEGQTLQEAKQAAHWDRGRNVFELTDHQGTFGDPGKTHLARRAPNSYRSPHGRGRRGRTRKINAVLKNLDLVAMRERGNGSGAAFERVYHATPAAAGAAYNRDCGRDHYWLAGTSPGGVGIWPILPAQRRRHC
jgi:hypothetical protein